MTFLLFSAPNKSKDFLRSKGFLAEFFYSLRLQKKLKTFAGNVSFSRRFLLFSASNLTKDLSFGGQGFYASGDLHRVAGDPTQQQNKGMKLLIPDQVDRVNKLKRTDI